MKGPFVAITLAIALSLLVLPAPPVAASCHTEDPATQVECHYNGVDHVKETLSNDLTGKGGVALTAETVCADGRTLDWSQGGVDPDPSCGPALHEATSHHGAVPSSAFPEGLRLAARVVMGQLWLGDDMVGVCVPTPSEGEASSCSVSIGATSQEECVTFRAVSHLNTGKEITTSMTGPWTTC